jgi:hypothetical protein
MHELQESDKEEQLQYCRWFVHFIQGGRDILDKIFYSDEVWFHLSGYVNSQNSRIWSAKNLHTFHERLLHSLKVGVSSRWRIISPIFFSEMITADRYQELIMNFIFLLEVDGKTAGFSKMGLRRIQQILQCRC